MSKQYLLSGVAAVGMFSSSIEGSAIDVMVPEHNMEHSYQPNTGYRLYHDVENAIDYQGLRIIDNDQDNLNDIVWGGSVIRLRNTLVETKTGLSLIALGKTHENASVILSDDVRLTAKTIHIVSQSEGGALNLNGVLETTGGDLVIEAKGDIVLPTLIIRGSVSIITSGKVVLPQNALVLGNFHIRAKSIETQGSVSTTGDCVWMTSESIGVGAELTSEYGITFIAGTSLDIRGMLGSLSIVAYAEEFKTYEGSHVVVRDTMGVTAQQVVMDGTADIKHWIVSTPKVEINSECSFGRWDIGNVQKLELKERASVVVGCLRDKEIPTAPGGARHFTNRGHLRVRSNCITKRKLRLERESVTVFDGALELRSDLFNQGGLIIKKLSTNDNITFTNRGVLDFIDDSSLTGYRLDLGGKITARAGLKIGAAAEGSLQQEGELTIWGKETELWGNEAQLNGKVHIKGNLHAQLNRLSLGDPSTELHVVGDLLISASTTGSKFTYVSQQGQIQVKGNITVLPGITCYMMLGELRQITPAFPVTSIKTNTWVQRGTVDVSTFILTGKFGDIRGDIKAKDTISVSTDSLIGAYSATANCVMTKSQRVDAAIHVEAKESRAEFEHMSDTFVYTVMANGGNHSAHLGSDTNANITINGANIARLEVAGVYTGNFSSQNTGTRAELYHRGEGRPNWTGDAPEVVLGVKQVDIHDFQSLAVEGLGAVKYGLRMDEANIDLRRNLAVATDHLFELTVKNLINNAEIRGNVVLRTREDLDNRVVIQGGNVELRIGGTYYKRLGSVVHGRNNEIIEADEWKVERQKIYEEATHYTYGEGPSVLIVQRETDTYQPEVVSHRHNVRHVTRKGNLDARSTVYEVTGNLHLEATLGSIEADMQQYQVGAGSTSFNIFGIHFLLKTNDSKPVFQQSVANAGGKLTLKAGKNINGDGFVGKGQKGVALDAGQDIKLKTVSKSYVSRRWSESGFLWFNSESGVDYDIAYAQPKLSSSDGNVDIQAQGRVISSGLNLSAGDSITVIGDKGVNLGAEALKVPFERQKKTLWGANATSIKGSEIIPLVFSAFAQKKVRIIAEHGEITGSAPMIYAREEVAIHAQDRIHFDGAKAAVVIDEEVRRGLILFGASMAPSRFEEENFRSYFPSLANNTAALRTPTQPRGAWCDPVRDGLGYHYGKSSGERSNQSGAMIKTAHLLIRQDNASESVYIVVENINANQTTIDTENIQLSGREQQNNEVVWDIGGVVGNGGLSIGLTKKEDKSTQHIRSQAKLGATHLKTGTTLENGAVQIYMSSTDGEEMTIVQQHAINHLLELGIELEGRLLYKVDLNGNVTVFEKQEEFMDKGVFIGNPHNVVQRIECPPIQTIEGKTELSIQASLPIPLAIQVGLMALSYYFCKKLNPDLKIPVDVLSLGEHVSEIATDQKEKIAHAINPAKELLGVFCPTVEISLPKHIHSSLNRILRFGRAIENNLRPVEPVESYYMRTRNGEEDNGDIGTLLRETTFQKSGVILSNLAYKTKSKEERDELIGKLDRHEGWEVGGDANYFGGDRAGGIVAKYTPRNANAAIQITAFMGTKVEKDLGGFWGEGAGYLLESNSGFVGASLLDARLLGLGGINNNFLLNYKESEWQGSGNYRVDDPHIFMGHSRGGAVAQLALLYAAVKNKKDFSKFGTLTFGAPAVFDKNLSEYVDLNMKSRTVHVALEGDVIPHVLGWENQPWYGGGIVADGEPYARTGEVIPLRKRKLFNHGVSDYLAAYEELLLQR